MWYNAPPGWYSITSPSSKLKAGHPHTHDHHSECRVNIDDSRHTLSAALIPQSGSPQLSSAPQALDNPGKQLGDPSWSPSPPISDPFIDEKKCETQGEEGVDGSLEPDRSGSRTFSDFIINALKEVPSITIDGEVDAEYDTFLNLCVHGEDDNFTAESTRTNTPVQTPSICDKPSPSPSSRQFSLPNEQHRAVPVTTRDLPLLPRSREPSDTSSIPLGQLETLQLAEPTNVVTVKQTPALIIRSKKEGLGLTRKSKSPALTNESKNEDGRWRQEALKMVGEAKRKWSANRSTSSLLRDISNLGPVHKAARIGSKSDLNLPLKTEMLTTGADRSPHGGFRNSSLRGQSLGHDGED